MTVDTRLALGQLTESQLVRRTDDIDLSYLFKHGLTQETAYGSLLKTHRRDIHRAVASAMEQTYADRLDELSDQLAYHWEQAAVPDRARSYLFRSGLKAARRFANTEALGLFDRALAMSHGAALEEIMAIRMARAEIWEFTSQYARALEDYVLALECARAAHRPNDECDILARMAWLHWLGGNSEEAVRLAREAEGSALALENESVALRAYLVGGLVAQAKGHIVDAYPRLRKALMASRKNGAKAMEGESLFFLGIQNNFMGRFGRASACAQQAYEIKAHLGDHAGEIVSLYLQARAEAGRGHYDSALQALEAGHKISEQTHNPFGLAQYPNTRAWLAAELGDWHTAYELDTAGLELARAAPIRPPEISNLINLILDSTALGKLDEADRHLIAVQRWIGQGQFGFHAWRWQIRLQDARARLLLAWGLYDDARIIVDGLLDWATSTQSVKYEARARMIRAEVSLAGSNWHAAQADLSRARRLADNMHHFPTQLYSRLQLEQLYRATGREIDADCERNEIREMGSRMEQCLTHPDLRHSYNRGLERLARDS